MTDTPPVTGPPNATVIYCPLRVVDCEWQLTIDGMTNYQINTQCELHTDAHTKEEYLLGMAEQVQEIHRLRARVKELESAVRGAVIASGGLTPPGAPEPLTVVRERKHGDVVSIAGQDRQLVGKRLPDGIAKAFGLPTRKDHEKRRRD